MREEDGCWWWWVQLAPPRGVEGEVVEAVILAATRMQARQLILDHHPRIHLWPGPAAWMRDHRNCHAVPQRPAGRCRPRLVSWWQPVKAGDGPVGPRPRFLVAFGRPAGPPPRPAGDWREGDADGRRP
jgi:hypothetical protein